jgi:hypothetical protein
MTATASFQGTGAHVANGALRLRSPASVGNAAPGQVVTDPTTGTATQIDRTRRPRFSPRWRVGTTDDVVDNAGFRAHRRQLADRLRLHQPNPTDPGVCAERAATGWTLISSSHTASVSEGNWAVAYKLAGAGESASQTPFSGGGTSRNAILCIVEVSGVGTDWGRAFQAFDSGDSGAGGGTTISITSRDTASPNTLALVCFMGEKQTASTAAATLSAGWTSDASATGGSTDYFPNMRVGHELFATQDTTVTATGTWAVSQTGISWVALYLERGHDLPAAGDPHRRRSPPTSF